MTEKIYRGTPDEDAEVWVIPTDNHPYPLKHVVYHSPTGFSWGYGGSGPADLPLKAGDDMALSMLADHFSESPTENDLYHGRPRCWQLHQKFKWKFIANLPFGEAFELHSSQIESWLAEQAPLQSLPPDAWLEAAYEDHNGCGLEDF